MPHISEFNTAQQERIEGYLEILREPKSAFSVFEVVGCIRGAIGTTFTDPYYNNELTELLCRVYAYATFAIEELHRQKGLPV